MSSASTRLSIIIVNYRSAQYVVQCIQSIRRYNILSFEIIVVDNDPGDTDIRLLELKDSILLIRMGYNAGFARANNSGIRVACGDTVLLLNPDTICTDDSITLCYQKLQSSDYVAAGVQLKEPDGKKQISGSHFVRGGMNHLLPIPYWGGFLRTIGYTFKTGVPGVQQAGREEVVGWISGAFLMVKKTAIEKAGLLDEDFFLYAEEVEWCYRLGKCGRLCLFGDLQVIHLEGSTINMETGTSQKGYYNLFDKKGLQLMVSNHLRVRKQYGTWWFLFLLLNYTFGIIVFWTCSTLHRLVTLRNPFSDWIKVAAFAGNVGRIWLLAPAMIRNKPHFYKMF